MKDRDMSRLSSVLAAIAILGCHSDTNTAASRQPSSIESQFDPMVTALLKDSTDDDFEQSRFWDALSKLARTRDWPRDEYDPGSPYRRRQGRAEMIAGLEPLVVVILYMADARYPGEDVQKLLLLDRRGRIRDTLSCSVNNRLVFWGGGLFRTDLPLNTQRDGAQLIVRYIPKDGGAISGNFAHEIHHDGQIYSLSLG